MKKYIYKILIVFAMGLLITGCGNGESGELDPRELVYRHERLDCMNDIRGEVSNYTFFEDTVFMCSIEWPEDGTEGDIGRRFFYKSNADGTGLEEISCDELCKDGEWLYTMEISGKGNLLLLFSVYDEELMQDTYILREVSQDGTLLSEINVKEWLDMGDDFIRNMKADKNGYVYLLTDYNIYIIDGEGDFAGQIEIEDYAENLVRTGTGEVLAGFNEASGYVLKKIDPEEPAYSEEYNTDIPYYNVSVTDGDETYDFYYSTEESVFGWRLEDNSAKEVMNMISGGVNTNYIGSIRMISGERALAIYGDVAWDDPHGIYLFQKMDPKDVKIKETITCVTLYADEEVKAEAYRFNKSQDKYQVVVRDYSSGENPHTDMYRDLMAGQCGDIVDLSGLSSGKYMNKGWFVDLYERMENDPDVSKDDFAGHLLKIMETDGRLYHISPTVGMNVVIARSSDRKEGEKLTFERLEQMEADGAKAFYQESKTTILSQLIEMNYGEYVDWNSGTCHFDGETFVKALEYAASFPADEDVVWDEETETLTSQIRKGNILFAQHYSVSAADIELYETMFEEDIILAGSPSETYTGPAMNMNREFAICEASEHKDGAWEFLKRYLSREYASGRIVDDTLLIPIRKDSQEDMVRRYTSTEPYTDDFGNEITPLSYEWEFEGVVQNVSPLTEKQMKVFVDAVERMDHKYVYDEDIMTMISEETADYFNGKKSAQQAAADVQKRVSVYMEDFR
nr:hypothetical protein [Lachnospiraceae bacterium]